MTAPSKRRRKLLCSCLILLGHILDFLQPLKILTELVVQKIGQDLGVLAILDIILLFKSDDSSGPKITFLGPPVS